MLDATALRQIMLEAVPFNRVLGAQVETVEPERVTVILPASPERLNHVGTVHAAAQFGLGEATAGAMCVAAFADLQRRGIAPVVTDASVRYRKPARGEMRGEATLSAAEQARVREEIAAGGRPRFSIAVRLTDQQGTATTELTFEWALLVPPAAKD
ncbi:MAG: YiiD C-terminal domain-containing protein [Chloroflexota bacterium]|nr:YiiD C-terminal domain-containing protein [Chloroflexota bacterium]